MAKTTLYLPDELLVTFRALARRTGRSQADLMREALQGYADQQQPPRFHSLGIAERSDLNAEAIDDWLAANWRPDADWRSEPDPSPE
jgi:predicted transcriptional regulator